MSILVAPARKQTDGSELLPAPTTPAEIAADLAMVEAEAATYWDASEEEDANMVFRVGDRRSLAPGYSIFQDSSWDARGTVVLCRDADIIEFRRGNALRMGRLEIRKGARIITGERAYNFLHASERELQESLG